MSIWKLLSEIVEAPTGRGEPPRMRTNSVWQQVDRQRGEEDDVPRLRDAKTVWMGLQLKDSQLFQTKAAAPVQRRAADNDPDVADDKATKISVKQTQDVGLIPAIKAQGGQVHRAPDGSGFAVAPHGYRIDTSVWKDWSTNRKRAEVMATTEPNKVPGTANASGAVKTFDVLVRGQMGTGRGGGHVVLVDKIVWASLDRSSFDSQKPEARAAKLEILMDTQDGSELASMFPAPEGGREPLQRHQPAELPPNPLAAPSKVQWGKGVAPQGPARPSAWNDIDLSRLPRKRR